MRYSINFFIFCLAVITIVTVSCRKPDTRPNPLPADSLQQINRWILDSMKKYYYWSNAMPQVSSLTARPEDFFADLLNSNDRFSEISNGSTIPFSSTAFENFGFHYIAFKHNSYSSQNLLGLVTLVGNDSPADRNGLSRGTYFTRVNDQLITENSVSGIQEILKTSASVKLTLAGESNGVWTEGTSIILNRGYFEERPVYNSSIFTRNGKITGYIFYNSFSEFFDGDVFSAFAKIKAKGATELILDLRYNSGGSVASAAKMLALSANVSATDIFGIYKGNNVIRDLSQPIIHAIANSSNNLGKDFNQVVVNRIPLSRIFILSSSVTASAAELLINNLKPYINVIHIGEPTFGKDLATFLVKDQRQPKSIFWQIRPVVYKMLNARSEGEYASGLTPAYSITQYSRLPLEGIGSNHDPLIGQALNIIYGTNSVQTEIVRGRHTSKTFSKPFSAGKIFFDSMVELGPNSSIEVDVNVGK